MSLWRFQVTPNIRHKRVIKVMFAGEDRTFFDHYIYGKASRKGKLEGQTCVSREDSVARKLAGDHAQPSIRTKEECTYPAALLVRTKINDNCNKTACVTRSLPPLV